MLRSEYFTEVLKKLNAYVSVSRIQCGVAWASYENTEAENNPYATTEPWPNSSEFNSAGVRNYATVEDGIDATVATLTNGYYDHLLNVLRTPECTSRDVLNAIDGSPWGSHPNTALLDTVTANWAGHNIEVPGSGSEPVAPTLPEGSVIEEKDETKAEEVIEIVHHVEMTKEFPVLHIGASGKAVVSLQHLLGLPADGQYKQEDVDLVKKYQSELGINSDGVVGPETWASFFI